MPFSLSQNQREVCIPDSCPLTRGQDRDAAPMNNRPGARTKAKGSMSAWSGGGERKARRPQASPSLAAWCWALLQLPTSPRAEPKSVTQGDEATAVHRINITSGTAFVCVLRLLLSLFILFYYYYFLTIPCGVRDLSSPTRHQTHAPCSGSTES